VKTKSHIESIRADLESLAGDDQALREAVLRLARALEPSLHLRLLDLVGEVALELSDQLPSGHVDVRLAGRDAHLIYVPEEESSSAPPLDDETTARLTLRMPEGLKARVEEAAAREGVSTNAWLVRAVSRNLERRSVGSRLTGFAQS
jgi:hypothetical protein